MASCYHSFSDSEVVWAVDKIFAPLEIDSKMPGGTAYQANVEGCGEHSCTRFCPPPHSADSPMCSEIVAEYSRRPVAVEYVFWKQPSRVGYE
jgi:hypothetical protein